MFRAIGSILMEYVELENLVNIACPPSYPLWSMESKTSENPHSKSHTGSQPPLPLGPPGDHPPATPASWEVAVAGGCGPGLQTWRTVRGQRWSPDGHSNLITAVRPPAHCLASLNPKALPGNWRECSIHPKGSPIHALTPGRLRAAHAPLSQHQDTS